MKIVILHRYFWPQPYPYAQMLKGIAEKLSGRYSVSILTTDSGDVNEKLQRSKWSKTKSINIQALSLGDEKRAGLAKKVVNSIYFGHWICIKLLFSRADIVMVATTPPVIIATLVRWLSFIRGFKYVYHCQDIHPEGMLIGGKIRIGIAYRFLLYLDKKNINYAWKVITLSKDMKKTLEDRGCKVSHINIINNFIFVDNDGPASRENKKNKVHFLFAGSLGRLQNLDILMDGIILLKCREDIHFTFMGDGIMFDEMCRCKADNNLGNVELLGQRSINEAVQAMQLADVGVVSIGTDIGKVAYPSKTMMYLGNGLPILALVNEGSEIYSFINSKKLGCAVSPGSADDVAKSIGTMADIIKNSPFDRSSIKGVARAYFGKDIILKKHLDLYS